MTRSITTQVNTMSTIWELDMGYLESLGKELRGYIKDDEVTVLPQLRTQYLAELNAVIEKMVSSSAKTDQMEALVKVCQHIATTVNTSRYHRLSQCIERIHSLVNKLRHQQNADSQPLNADALFFLAQNHGIAISRHDLNDGKASSVSFAYQQGYLSISEAFDALSALFKHQRHSQPAYTLNSPAYPSQCA